MEILPQLLIWKVVLYDIIKDDCTKILNFWEFPNPVPKFRSFRSQIPKFLLQSRFFTSEVDSESPNALRIIFLSVSMEGSSLIHGCVTKSTCNLRLSVKNVPKNVPKSGNVPKLVPKPKNDATKVCMHLSSLPLPRFLLCAGATMRSIGANNLQGQGRHGLRCGLWRGPAAPLPSPHPRTWARNVATACAEALGVDVLLQRVGLLVRLHLGDVHLCTLKSLCCYCD